MTPPSILQRRTIIAALIVATIASCVDLRAGDGAQQVEQQQDPKRREITVEVLRSEDNLTITLKATFPEDMPGVKVSLFNLLGKLVEVHPVTTAVKGMNPFVFRTRGLPNGPYIVVLEASGQRIINKVMISR